MNCSRCGAPLTEQSSEKMVCEYCGEVIRLEKQEEPKEYTQQTIYTQQSSSTQQTINTVGNPQDKLGCFMWGLCFIFPILGIILYFVYKQYSTQKAKSALWAALISLGIGIVFCSIAGN